MEKLRLEILKALNDCGGYLMPEKALMNEVRLAMPKMLVSEFTLEIRWLEEKGLIVGTRPELGGAPKWRISESGKVTLAEALS
jgi:hypothetical protein